jgi:hypothetical protein
MSENEFRQVVTTTGLTAEEKLSRGTHFVIAAHDAKAKPTMVWCPDSMNLAQLREFIGTIAETVRQSDKVVKERSRGQRQIRF